MPAGKCRTAFGMAMIQHRDNETSVQPQPRAKREHAMGAARREPRGVKITMRAGKPLPVLYTPSQGKRGKYWYKTEIRVQDRTNGHSVFGCARPCVLKQRKGVIK